MEVQGRLGTLIGDKELVCNPAWRKYGLSIYKPWERTKPELERGIRQHNLVAAYLESHPEIAKRYRPDQRGVVGYYDVLAMAESE